MYVSQNRMMIFEQNDFVQALTLVSDLLLFLLEHGYTLGAVPLALGLGGEGHAAEMEPLDRTVLVVAPDHFAVGHLGHEIPLNLEN